MKALIRQLRTLDEEARKTLRMIVLVPGLLLLVGGIGYKAYEPFASFVREVSLTIFGLVATPIIFESISIFTGMTLILFFGWLKLVVFGAEWVEEAPGDAAATLDEAEEAQVALAVAEGHLQMGQVDEAHNALLQVPRREWEKPECKIVRLAVGTAQKSWGECRVIVAELEAEENVDETIYAESVARYELAWADTIVEDGSGTPGSRRAEAKQLRKRAQERCPEIFAEH